VVRGLGSRPGKRHARSSRGNLISKSIYPNYPEKYNYRSRLRLKCNQEAVRVIRLMSLQLDLKEWTSSQARHVRVFVAKFPAVGDHS
jgi:hypothetical protein